MLTNTYIPASPWSSRLPQTTKQHSANFSDKGAIRYKDEYGIITESTWELIGSQLNIITITKQPRVWGCAVRRKTEAGKQYIEGIITTVQQIFTITEVGYTIIGEYSEQNTGFFIANDPCVSYSTRFANYNDHLCTDQIEVSMNGNAWTDASGDSYWDDYNTSNSQWIDVWS